MSNVRTMLTDYLLGSGDLKRNFVKNPIATKNVLNTAVSGAVITRNTTNPLTNDADAQIVMDAVNDYAEFQTNSLDRAMQNQNCMVKFDYRLAKGAGATVLVRLMDASNVVSELELISEASVRPVAINFVCGDPSTASYTVRFIQTVATTTSTLNVTNLYLGKSDNIGTVSQAEVYGTANLYSAASCQWSHSSTSFISYSPDSDCATPTVTGKVSAPSTKIPAIQLNNAPPGKYVVTASFGAFAASSSNISFRLHDGTSSKTVFQNESNGVTRGFTVIDVFEYTTTGNRTIEVQGRAGGSTVVLQGNDSGTPKTADLTFTVVRYPLESQTVLTPELGQWRVDAKIDGISVNFELGTAVVSTPQEMTSPSMTLTNNTNVGSSSSVKVACSGTNPPTGSTCSAGSESNGISFEIPTAGLYRVCTAFSADGRESGGNLSYNFRLVETPINAQTVLQTGPERANLYTINDIGHSVYLCGNFNFTTTGQKVVRTFYTKTLSASFQRVLASSDFNRTVQWTVERLTANVQPVIVNSIASNGTGPFRMEAAQIANSGTPTVTSQTGSWITSLTDGGIGNTTINVATGIFSSAPICTATFMGTTAQNGYITLVAPTTTAVQTQVRDNASNALDLGFSVICIGLKGTA